MSPNGGSNLQIAIHYIMKYMVLVFLRGIIIKDPISDLVEAYEYDHHGMSLIIWRKLIKYHIF